VSNKPILCGKCGTSSDEVAPLVMTSLMGFLPERREIVQVSCQHKGCGHSVSSDSLPAALAKFEEKVEPVK